MQPGPRSWGIILLGVCCIILGGTMAVHLTFEALTIVLGVLFIIAGFLLVLSK